MLKAGGRAQGSSSHLVLNEAANKKRTVQNIARQTETTCTPSALRRHGLCRAQQAEKRTSILSAAIVGVGVLALFTWWKRRNSKNSDSHSGNSTEFSRQVKLNRSTATSGLPRNKVGNNKKNKARQKIENDRRTEKRQSGKSGPADPNHKEDKDNTIILTSTFVDSSPKVSNLPKAQRKGTPAASEKSVDPAFADQWSKKS